MDVATARQYHKTLSELFSELQNKQTPAERMQIGVRMQNLTKPLFVVHSAASQHIIESLEKLAYPDTPVVNAVHHTIQESLQQIFETIQQHPEPHFVIMGQERVFAKPVAALELRSLVEKERLFDHMHTPQVCAIEAASPIADVLLHADSNILKPVLSRLGFPHADALVFFKTRAQPSLGVPIDEMPSMKLVRFRSGIPVNVMQHRIL